MNNLLINLGILLTMKWSDIKLMWYTFHRGETVWLIETRGHGRTKGEIFNFAVGVKYIILSVNNTPDSQLLIVDVIE